MTDDEPLRAWYDALVAVRRRFIEITASGLFLAGEAEALVWADYATSDETRTLLLACSTPIRRFVSEELGERPVGPDAQTFAAELRAPLRNVRAAEIQQILRPHIERLLASGVAVGAIMHGSLSETDPAYALIEDLLLQYDEPWATATYYVWITAFADIRRILIEGGANQLVALKRLGDDDVAAFIEAARTLGQLDKRRHQKNLRKFATTYLMLGYGLYLMHTRDYHHALSGQFDEFTARAMLEMVVRPGTPLPEPRG